MNRADILSLLQSATVQVLGEDAPRLTEEFELGRQAAIDSLDLVEIMMIVEEEIAIEVDSDGLTDVTTVGDVFGAVAGLAAAAGIGLKGSEIVGLTPRAALPASTAHLLLSAPPRILETELTLFMASPGREAGTSNLEK